VIEEEFGTLVPTPTSSPSPATTISPTPT
jgi:hypothetical protein